jgi:hypothetical protein
VRVPRLRLPSARHRQSTQRCTTSVPAARPPWPTPTI